MYLSETHEKKWQVLEHADLPKSTTLTDNLLLLQSWKTKSVQ